MDGRTNTFDKTRAITVGIIENFPERLPGERDFVWMDVAFVTIDSGPVDRYFNHTVEGDYILKHGGVLDDAKEKWVSFMVTDRSGDSFGRCIALKKDDITLVNVILNLKRGDALRLGGRITKMMNTEVRWFLIDSIDQL